MHPLIAAPASSNKSLGALLRDGARRARIPALFLLALALEACGHDVAVAPQPQPVPTTWDSTSWDQFTWT